MGNALGLGSLGGMRARKSLRIVSIDVEGFLHHYASCVRKGVEREDKEAS